MNNENKIDKILYRSLEEMGNHAWPPTQADCVEIDYSLNSQGYRCNEFNNQEILVLGCSHTEGQIGRAHV